MNILTKNALGRKKKIKKQLLIICYMLLMKWQKLLAPFLPEASEKILGQIETKKSKPLFLKI